MKYYISRFVDSGFEDALSRVTDGLAAQGFSILSDIDMQSTMQAKLGADFHPYRILGSCNASLAQQALSLEPQIGALMPCNWMVQQHPDGRVEVSVMNPGTLVEITGNAQLQSVQDEVSSRVQTVMDSL